METTIATRVTLAVLCSNANTGRPWLDFAFFLLGCLWIISLIVHGFSNLNAKDKP